MIFFSKKQAQFIESSEYKILSNRLGKLEVTIEALESKIDFLSAELKILRKKKLNIKNDEELEDTKELNNPVILPYNGAFK